MRQVGPNGLALIRHCEGVVPEVYLDSIGIPTAGVGHVIRAADGPLKVGDPVSEEQISRWLQSDLSIAAAGVDRRCPHLTQNQFDACVSLTFNIGVGAFDRSTLASLIDADDLDGAADQFKVWNRAGNTHPKGLKIRRALERDLFLAPDGPMPAGWLNAHNAEFTS